MYNKVIIMGRLTRDIELRNTQSGTPFARFTVACDRYSKNQEEQADFIACTAWGKNAENISKYFGKGRLILIEGNLKTGTYEDKNGTKHFTTEVYVDRFSFTGEPKQQAQNGGYTSQSSGNRAGSPYIAGTQQPPQNNQSYEKTGIGDLSDFEEVLSDDGIPF